ncbi:MAG: formylglycine-generating enzyme family protein [Candidatus Cloacimonetes bacterium]|nr:formylglycine-generating enzyme family protein [Candidatus Cloacimonadota bacterium]
MKKIILLLFVLLIVTIHAKNSVIYIKCKPNVQILLDDEIVGSTTSEMGGLLINNVVSGSHVLKAIESESKIKIKSIFVEPDKKIVLTFESFKLEKKIIHNIDLNSTDNMIFIQGGTFKMGSNDINKFSSPIHSVTVSDFYMSKYEITQKDWVEIMGNNPSSNIGIDNPIDNVSWFAAIEFCNRKSLKEGLEPCYNGERNKVKCDYRKNGYRLPTEAEWEFAAQGGIKSKNFKYSGSNNVDDVAWYHVNSDKRSNPVGNKKSNGLGIYDMSGNLWEWCNNWLGNYTKRPKNNPHGPNIGKFRVLRGGSWNVEDILCSNYIRFLGEPDDSDIHVGFRIVRTP